MSVSRTASRGCQAFVMSIFAITLVACLPSAISREDAARLAVQAAGPESIVSSLEHGPLGTFVDTRTLPDIPRDRSVWAVTVSGQFEGSCVVTATGESRCPPAAGSALVRLDDNTGEMLLLEVPAP